MNFALNPHVRFGRPEREPEPPRKKSTMKKIACIILTGVALAFAASQLTSCVTSKRTTYHADGSKEVIEERKPAIEKDTKQFISDVFWSWSPRPRPAPTK